MITFTVSFLLAFFLDKPKIAKKKTQSDKATNVRHKKNKPIFAVESTPEIVFDAKNFKEAAHIQYELIPNKLRFDLDVICWGPIAKMISTDGILTLKTIVKDDIAWVPISVEHYIDNLALSDIKFLHEHIVHFEVYDIRSKAAALVKNDRIIFRNEDIARNDIFVNINESSEDESEISLRNFIRNLIMKCVNIPRNDIVSWMHIPDDYNIHYETIQKVSVGEKVVCKDFVLPFQTTQKGETKVRMSIETDNDMKQVVSKESKKKTTQTQTTKSKVKKLDASSIRVQVPAEVLFTDPLLSKYDKQNMTDGLLKHIFIFLSSSQLLTRSQKLILNPLVIKIKKLRNLPVNSLNSLGVESVFASYSIPYFADCKSVQKPTESKVVFNESHIFFTDSIPKMKLIEFMQTQKFFVEIYGNIGRIGKVTPKYSLFGSEANDEYISRLGPNFQHFDPEEGNDESPVLLAVANFDISSLVENIWDFREIGQCHEPNTTISKKPSSYQTSPDPLDMMTVCDINLKMSKPSLMREAELIELGTTLEVEVYLMAPQAASLIVHQMPHTFKRLFMILNIPSTAKIIFDEIMTHNSVCFASQEKTSAVKKPTDSDTHTDVLTGFVIDNGNNFFFYLEGSSIGFILNIWHQVDDADSQVGKIFFNTDNAFEHRLYNNLIDRGLFVITLKIPLQEIFSKTLIYCRKRMPAPCLEALKKLCLLFNSSQYRCILQQNLLPTAEELLSLDLEWGVPLRWKVKEDK